MRKYIYKFKNYTSVEVDNLHDLKEGDLALYEDKFVTRNNGKVEEVVKSEGGGSKEEYSTDYPEDFYLTYWFEGTGYPYSSTSQHNPQHNPQHLSIYKNNTVYYNNGFQTELNNECGAVQTIEFNIPNIDLDSVVLIYKIYDGYDEDNLLTTGIQKAVHYTSSDSNIGLKFNYQPTEIYGSRVYANTLSIEFKQKDNPTKYLVDIGVVGGSHGTSYKAKTSYKVLRIKYTDIIGTY